jgi:hypothetical protein
MLCHDAMLEQKGANLVDDAGAVAHQSFHPGAVSRGDHGNAWPPRAFVPFD